jgi:hypothetical protein
VRKKIFIVAHTKIYISKSSKDLTDTVLHTCVQGVHTSTYKNLSGV